MDVQATSKVNNLYQANEISYSKNDYGKSVGNVKLSDEATEYYKSLKERYSNLEFVLVSRDEKANAQAHASSYATPGKTVVLIDEDKIERMATDESYRNKYEGLIQQASSGISSLKAQLEANGQAGNVSSYGVTINDDGTSTYFAVLRQGTEAQKERIEKQIETRREERHEAAKKARAAEREEQIYDRKTGPAEDSVTIYATSAEDLLQKINDYVYEQRTNSVQTEQELQIGQHIDFRG